MPTSLERNTRFAELSERVEHLRAQPRNSSDFHKWHVEVIETISALNGSDSPQLTHFRSIVFEPTKAPGARIPESKYDYDYRQGLTRAAEYLGVLAGEVGLGRTERPAESKGDLAKVEHILKRFHVVATQLLHRYGARPPFIIDDEYDVQDLLHALLSVEFEDIRKEEWVPSYAGGASRTDFVLKGKGIVIEVKKTRHGLADRDTGDQLIIDIARYASHPDCEKLVCFVYDPEGRMRNPRGLENDLANTKGRPTVTVVVAPF